MPQGRRYDMMARADEECLKHSGHEARLKAVEAQSDTLFEKVDKLSGKINLLLGGVMILWPAIQIFVWLIGKK
jgi:hypothetical protein